MSGPAILALDLSSHTGWAVRRRDGSVASGVEHFPLGELENPAARYERFSEWVRSMASTTESRIEVDGAVSVERVCHAPAVDVIACPDVDLIAWEKAIAYGGRRNAGALLFVLEAEVVKVAWRLGLPVRTIDPQTLKKHATGKRGAKKPEMIMAAAKRWPDRPAALIDDNEADALCVLGWAIDTHEVAT